MDDRALAKAAETVAARLDRPDAPGAAIGIVRGTRVVWRGALGLASVELGVKLAPETVMTVASVTKQFTCLALHMLAAEGRIDLDAEALPGISYRHLMRNVSGLPDLMETYTLGGGDLSVPAPRPALLDLVKRQTARNFAPGTDFNYCNTNFALLQEAAERIENRPFAEILAARILAPARMTSARLGTRADETVPGMANGYFARGQGYARAIDSWPGGGEGGLRASLDDMIEWAKNWVTRKVGGALLDAIATPLPFANGRPNFYACGVQVLPWRGLATIGHGGLMPGFLTEFCRVPAEDLTVIVIANSDRFQPWLVTREILDRARGLDPDDAHAAGDAFAPGAYLSDDGRTTLELLLEGGRAKARQHGVAFPSRATARRCAAPSPSAGTGPAWSAPTANAKPSRRSNARRCPRGSTACGATPSLAPATRSTVRPCASTGRCAAAWPPRSNPSAPRPSGSRSTAAPSRAPSTRISPAMGR
jgi:D-aminopeptidase